MFYYLLGNIMVVLEYRNVQYEKQFHINLHN